MASSKCVVVKVCFKGVSNRFKIKPKEIITKFGVAFTGGEKKGTVEVDLDNKNGHSEVSVTMNGVDREIPTTLVSGDSMEITVKSGKDPQIIKIRIL